jgi:hypothetical protein
MKVFIFLTTLLFISIHVSGDKDHLRLSRRIQLMGGYHPADPNDPMVSKALTFVQTAFVQNSKVQKLYADLFLMTKSPQNLALVIWNAQTQVCGFIKPC